MAKFTKVQKTRTKEFPRLNLYLDDIERVVEVFESNTPTYSIEINEELEFETLKDLLEYDKIRTVKSFKIRSANPNVFVHLTGEAARLLIMFDDTISLGIFHRLADILTKCKSQSFQLISRILFLVSVLILGILPSFIFHDTKVALFALLCSLIAFAILIVIWTSQDPKNYCKIYLVTRENRPGFFKENKDKIILAVISGVIGALVKTVIDLLFKK